MRDKNQSLVSLCMVTYNHERLIAKAVESVLQQVVPFPYEIVLSDDGSRDATPEICAAYASRYPGIVRYIQRTRSEPERQGFSAPYMYNFLETLRACRGKYVAWLDGDDAWFGRTKLEKQIAHLEANPGCAMTTCNFWMQEADVKAGDRAFYPRPDSPGVVRDMDLRSTDWPTVLMPTSGIVVRRGTYDEIYGDAFRRCFGGDMLLIFLAGRHGHIHYFHKPMSLYRFRNEGSWHGNSAQTKALAMLNTIIGLVDSGVIEDVVTVRWLKALFGYNAIEYARHVSDWDRLEAVLNELCTDRPDRYMNDEWVIRRGLQEIVAARSMVERVRQSKSYRIGNRLLGPARKLKEIVLRSR